MTARQVPHLPWTDVDLNGLKLVLEEWARKGFEGDLDRRSLDNGFVTITTKNWLPGRQSFVMMELHKLDGGKGWFGRKTNWVVQLYSCHNIEGALASRQGCVGGRSVLSALDNGLNDVGKGFVSNATLESMGIEAANQGTATTTFDVSKSDVESAPSSADATNEISELLSREYGSFQLQVAQLLADHQETESKTQVTKSDEVILLPHSLKKNYFSFKEAQDAARNLARESDLPARISKNGTGWQVNAEAIDLSEISDLGNVAEEHLEKMISGIDESRPVVAKRTYGRFDFDSGRLFLEIARSAGATDLTMEKIDDYSCKVSFKCSWRIEEKLINKLENELYYDYPGVHRFKEGAEEINGFDLQNPNFKSRCRAGGHYFQEEIDMIVSQYKNWQSITSLSKRFQRSESAITSLLAKHNLAELLEKIDPDTNEVLLENFPGGLLECTDVSELENNGILKGSYCVNDFINVRDIDDADYNRLISYHFKFGNHNQIKDMIEALEDKSRVYLLAKQFGFADIAISAQKSIGELSDEDQLFVERGTALRARKIIEDREWYLNNIPCQIQQWADSVAPVFSDYSAVQKIEIPFTKVSSFIQIDENTPLDILALEHSDSKFHLKELTHKGSKLAATFLAYNYMVHMWKDSNVPLDAADFAKSVKGDYWPTAKEIRGLIEGHVD